MSRTNDSDADRKSRIATQTTRRQFLSAASAITLSSALASDAAAAEEPSHWLVRGDGEGRVQQERVSIDYDPEFGPEEYDTIEIDTADGERVLVLINQNK